MTGCPSAVRGESRHRRWRLGGHKRPSDSQSALVWRGTQTGLQSDSVLPFKAKDAIQGMGWSSCQLTCSDDRIKFNVNARDWNYMPKNREQLWAEAYRRLSSGASGSASQRRMLHRARARRGGVCQHQERRLQRAASADPEVKRIAALSGWLKVHNQPRL